MPRKKHSKESIVATLQSLATGLKKDTLSTREVGAGIAGFSGRYLFRFAWERT
jgi:hypothetical protein